MTVTPPLDDTHFGLVETYTITERSWDLDMLAEVAVMSREVVTRADINEEPTSCSSYRSINAVAADL